MSASTFFQPTANQNRSKQWLVENENDGGDDSLHLWVALKVFKTTGPSIETRLF